MSSDLAPNDDYKTMKVNDKFSIVYSPSMNDRPFYVLRHGAQWKPAVKMTNLEIALFYALLEEQETMRP